eukprot:scaffold609_cov198-Alexandrium_tamarense.AAC.9
MAAVGDCKRIAASCTKLLWLNAFKLRHDNTFVGKSVFIMRTTEIERDLAREIDGKRIHSGEQDFVLKWNS